MYCTNMSCVLCWQTQALFSAFWVHRAFGKAILYESNTAPEHVHLLNAVSVDVCWVCEVCNNYVVTNHVCFDLVPPPLLEGVLLWRNNKVLWKHHWWLCECKIKFNVKINLTSGLVVICWPTNFRCNPNLNFEQEIFEPNWNHASVGSKW